MMVGIDKMSIDEDRKRKIIRQVDADVAVRTNFAYGFIHITIRRFVSRGYDFSIEREGKKQVSGFFESDNQTIKQCAQGKTGINKVHLRKVELKKNDAETTALHQEPELENKDAEIAIPGAVVCAKSATPPVEVYPPPLFWPNIHVRIMGKVDLSAQGVEAEMMEKDAKSAQGVEAEMMEKDAKTITPQLENKNAIITTQSAIMRTESAAPSAKEDPMYGLMRAEFAAIRAKELTLYDALRAKFAALRTGMEKSAAKFAALRTEMEASAAEITAVRTKLAGVH
jgi:hypothetical protein